MFLPIAPGSRRCFGICCRTPANLHPTKAPSTSGCRMRQQKVATSLIWWLKLPTAVSVSHQQRCHGFSTHSNKAIVPEREYLVDLVLASPLPGRWSNCMAVLSQRQVLEKEKA